MGRKGSFGTGSGSPDLVIARLAASQHGRIAAWQARDLGIENHLIESRVRRGLLVSEHKGVYRLASQPQDWDGKALGALLASGAGSALSHRAAAFVHGLIDYEPPIEVSAPRSRAPLDRLKVHRPRSLAPDVVERRGLRVTTPARTLVDLCAVLSATHVAALVHEAEVLRLVSRAELRETLERSRGRRGIGKLKPFARTEAAVPRSQLERRFRDLVADAGIAAPKTNERLQIGGRWFELDAHWPEARVAVELDGWQFHRTRERFESDRARDAALAAAGWTTIRLTWRRLRDEKAGVAIELRRLLERLG